MRLRINIEAEDGRLPPPPLPAEAVAAPGEPVSIGRAPAATLCVPDAEELATQHAVVVAYDACCRVYALTADGVLHNGRRVHEAQLAPGDALLAATVRLRASAPPADGGSDDAWWAAEWSDAPLAEEDAWLADTVVGRVRAARQRVVDAVLDRLRAAPEPLYAVIDPAQPAGDAAYLWARRSGEVLLPIPDDAETRDYLEAAPHLVRLPAESPLPGKLLSLAWGTAALVFLTSPRPIPDVLAALRALYDATLPDGTRVLFRFHDPRVLGPILANRAVDAAPFFSAVAAWYVEDPPPGDDDATADQRAPADDDGGSDGGEPPDEAWLLPRTDGGGQSPPATPVALREFRGHRVYARVGAGAPAAARALARTRVWTFAAGDGPTGLG